jgi:hypothetical protein
LSGAARRSTTFLEQITYMIKIQKHHADRSAKEAMPRFNHSVPEFILNRFASSGKICVFDKHSQKAFKLPPRRAMGERDFHNVHIDDAVISFENKFTHVENLAAPIIAQIVERKALDRLTPMDIATLNMFVALQLSRSKSRRMDQNTITTEVRRRWPEIEINPAPERIDDWEFEKLSALKITFDNLAELTKPLVLKHMFLMVRDCRDDIYISDAPVVMHNAKTFGPYGNLGLAVPGVEIYFPLSPDVVLAYFCPSLMKETEEQQAEAERRISAAFAAQILSRTGISRAEILRFEQMRTEVKRSKDYFRLVKENRVAPMDSQNVLFLNSLQVRASYRFVAAARPNFSFARKALSERPHWKEGLRVKVN